MRRSMVLLMVALLYSVTFCVGTGVIPAWGRWYSSSLHYRDQTDAFSRGELSLAGHPSMIDHDLVWSGNGVHQVWGLGVPAWRWVFEVLARWIWQSDFPDRLSFMVALGIWAWRVLITLSKTVERIERKPCLIGSGGYFVLTLVTLFNPCFVSMCATRFAVYEEACAYAYLYGVGLMLAVVEMGLNPSHRKLAWIALLAGLGPLVRPTLVFQGLGAMGVGFWLARSNSCGVGGWVSKWGVPGIVYSAGMLLLLLTNEMRFGSAVEFGHSLNFQILFGSMYATRFDHPFGEETLCSALLELLGAMFRVLYLNGDDYYAAGVLATQSGVLRWREFYFTTFDVGWPLLWVAALTLSCRLRRRVEHPDGYMRGVAVVAISSCSALCAFYLRTPVISSRYVGDFAPAFTAFTWLSVLGITRLLASVRPGIGRSGVALLFGWWCNQIGSVEGDTGPPTAVSARYVAERRMQIPSVQVEFPGEYRVGSAGDLDEGPVDWESEVGGGLLGIRYNGIGWDTSTGKTRPLVALLVAEAEFVEVDIEVAEGVLEGFSGDRWIRPKLHLTSLQVSSSTDLGEGHLRIRFEIPTHLRGRPDPTALFIALGSPEGLSASVSPYILRSVRWR